MSGFEKLKKLLETSNDEGLKSEIVHMFQQVGGVEHLPSGAGEIMNADLLNESAFTVTLDVDLSVLKTSHFAENSSQVGSEKQPPHVLYEGDNMLTLTLLQGTHTGAVDTIYIDPPYNTGNEFTYDDKRVRVEGNDAHSHWLSTMYPRLCLAYNLLKPSGVFFVSIDDREQAHLKLLCDRVFGEQNFIAQMVWDGGTVKNNASLVSTTHEYVLVYAKSLPAMKRSKVRWRETRPGVDKVLTKYDTLKKAHGDDYDTISGELKKWIPTAGLPKRLTMFTSVDHRGPYTYADLSAPNSKGARYPLHHPITGKPCRIPTRGWAYTEETLTRLVNDDRVIFGPDETAQPLKKLYLHETTHQVPRTRKQVFTHTLWAHVRIPRALC